MQCLFLGGPLDGELRDIDQKLDRTPRLPYAPPEITITTLTVAPREYSEYVIANGIARHESVSEEEVATRVAGENLMDRRQFIAATGDNP